MSTRNTQKRVTALAVVVLAGLELVLALPSTSATSRAGSTATAAGIRRAEDSPVIRQVVTEHGVRFSFRVPNSWERFSTLRDRNVPRGPISFNKSIVGPQGAEAIIYWTSFPNGDHADRCASVLSRRIGPSAAALAAAVSEAPGTRLVAAPASVALGGRPAKYVVLRVRKPIGCEPGFFYSWREVFGGAFWRDTAVGDTIRVWIVDVGATRLFIAAATRANWDLAREVRQIVESIRFDS